MLGVQNINDNDISISGSQSRVSSFILRSRISILSQRLGRFASQEMASGSKARVYADVNFHRPREYWDYEAHVIEWG